MNVRTESASQIATEVVLARVATLEAAGFVRPRSLSPDAYLAALADLDEVWADDLRSLASTYARLRFGGATNGVDPASALAASERVARSAEGLIESGSIAALCELWRLRTSMPPEPHEVTPPPAEAERSKVPAAESVGAVVPSRVAAMKSRFSLPQVSLRGAASAFVVGGALASVGLYCFPDGLRSLASAFAVGSEESVPMPTAVMTLISPAPFPVSAVAEGPDPPWPRLFPATHPHAELLNEPIAASLSELAAIYCDLGSMQRAGAIYAYVAHARPRDGRAQTEYANFLLNALDPETRDAEGARQFAELAYALNPADAQTAETLASALFATGDIARAVEIQQEWLDRERQAELAVTDGKGREGKRRAG